MGYGRIYTTAEREFLISYIPGHSHKEITEEFNRRFNPPVSAEQVKSYIGNHKLNTGRTGHFQKNNVPYNKGMKRGSWGRMAETQFAKGNTPPQCRPVGSERKDKRDGTIYVKVSDPNVWKGKKTVVWEHHNGEVRPGHIVIFLDGDTGNYDISNLCAVTREENLRLNQMRLRTDNAPLSMAAVNMVRLQKKTREVDRDRKRNNK